MKSEQPKMPMPVNPMDATREVPLMTVLLMLGSLVVFVGLQIPVGVEMTMLKLGIVPRHVVSDFSWTDPLALVFSQFLHPGWLSLLCDLFFLWTFGSKVEAAIGHLRFLVGYLAWGCVAGVVQIIGDTASITPVNGAAGAISGLLGAYLVLCVNAPVVIWSQQGSAARQLALPAWIFLVLWIAVCLGTMPASNSWQAAGILWLGIVAGFFAGLAVVFFSEKPRLRTA